jgi:hypothetical protein
MNNKPTLKEFLRNNPGKGLNDYYKEYGDIKDSRPLTIQPVPPPPPQKKPKSEVVHVVDRSDEFPPPPPPPKRPGLDAITIVAAMMVIVAFFLPWINVSEFKAFKDLAVYIPGYELFDSMGLLYESPPPPLFYTIYLIPAGGLITLLGELVRSWVIRIMGQVLVVSFSIYWAFEIHQIFLYAQEALKMEDLQLLKFLHYGFYLSCFGAVLLFIDLLRTLFGNR